jgi:uncharacterized cupin superfamily protein
MRVREVPLRETKHGLVADGDGWFVINAAESRWRDAGRFGCYCDFEGKRRFRQLGINVSVLEPGQAIGLYHRERAQEGFLVVAGECLLLVEGEERRLRAWDFVHCPAGTEHIFVGAGGGPCAILMIGARPEAEELHYPVSELAAKHGASVAKETPNPDEAYADWPGGYVPVPLPWPVE